MKMTIECDCFAVLDESDKRSEIWKFVFQNDKMEEIKIPLKHPLKHKTFNGFFFEADPIRLKPEQINRLIDKLSETYNVSKDRIKTDLSHGYLPIKTDNVTVNICKQHGLAML